MTQNNGNRYNNGGRRTNGFRKSNHFNGRKNRNKMGNQNQNDQRNQGKESSKETNIPLVYEPEKAKTEQTYKKIVFKEDKEDEGEKEEIPIYCDGTKEQFLKTIQEWDKATKGNTYIFNKDNINRTIQKFTK